MKYIKLLIISLLLLQMANIETFAIVTNNKPNVQQAISNEAKHRYLRNYLVYLRSTLIEACGYDNALLKSYSPSFEIRINNKTGEIISVTGHDRSSYGKMPMDIGRGELRIKRLQKLKPYDMRYNFNGSFPVYNNIARLNIALNSAEYNLTKIYSNIQGCFVGYYLRSLNNVENLSAKARVKLKFDNKIDDGSYAFYKTVWKPISVTLLRSSGDADFDELMITCLKKQKILFDIVPNETLEFDITLYGHYSYGRTYQMAEGNIMFVK